MAAFGGRHSLGRRLMGTAGWLNTAPLCPILLPGRRGAGEGMCWKKDVVQGAHGGSHVISSPRERNQAWAQVRDPSSWHGSTEAGFWGAGLFCFGRRGCVPSIKCSGLRARPPASSPVPPCWCRSALVVSESPGWAAGSPQHRGSPWGGGAIRCSLRRGGGPVGGRGPACCAAVPAAAPACCRAGTLSAPPTT